jgi:hypothetical protein
MLYKLKDTEHFFMFIMHSNSKFSNSLFELLGLRLSDLTKADSKQIEAILGTASVTRQSVFDLINDKKKAVKKVIIDQGLIQNHDSYGLCASMVETWEMKSIDLVKFLGKLEYEFDVYDFAGCFEEERKASKATKLEKLQHQ